MDSAQFELRLIQERTKSGLAAARARGRNVGRSKVTAAETKVVLAKELHATRVWRSMTSAKLYECRDRRFVGVFGFEVECRFPVVIWGVSGDLG